MTWTEKKFLFSMAYGGAFGLAGAVLLHRLPTYDAPLKVLILPGIFGAISIVCVLYGYRLLKQIKKDLLG